MTHDYKRNGTTTLFATLEFLSGTLIGTCFPKHRHQEWLRFLRLIDRQTPPALDLHLIVDNYATHKHPAVQHWLARHPRFRGVRHIAQDEPDDRHQLLDLRRPLVDGLDPVVDKVGLAAAFQLVDRSGEPMNLDGLKERARKIESDFDLKYKVYRDLRNHKLVVKTGFKFGTHFRVYKQVESLAKVPHSEYLVHTVPDDHVFMPPVLSRAVRLAHSVRKQMLFAYPDEDVRYLEIRRLKP